MTMAPVLVPLFQRGVRHVLRQQGVRTRYVETSLGRVHVYDAKGTGSRPPIVLLHGLSADAGGFAPLVRRLCATASRVVMLDYPGHGFSDDANAVLTSERLFAAVGEVLDEVLRDEPATLVGNSLGGAVAVARALARPQRVAGLVLLSPAGAPSSDHEWNDVTKAFAVGSRKSALEFMARVHPTTPLVGRALAHEMPALMRKRAVRDLLGTATREQSIGTEALRSLAMPILLWWGEADRLLPVSHLAWWRRELPAHAVVERPPLAGHCPQLDAPGLVAERICAFVEEVAHAPARV